MFSFFKKKADDFFVSHEKQIIVDAIKKVEKQTSGEVRVYIESKCRFVQAIDRAFEIFENLDMHKTEERNAVLVYVALKHRQLAIYADDGIYDKINKEFWKEQLQIMQVHFGKEDFANGIANVVTQIGKALHQHFPYDRNDVNELPDDIVFGK